MNVPAVVLRSLGSNAAPQGGKRRANRKSRIETERQTGGERRTELPAPKIRRGTQHLQLDTREPGNGKVLRVQMLEIVAAANDRLISLPAVMASFAPRALNGVNRGHKTA